jgi:hypothetical protein
MYLQGYLSGAAERGRGESKEWLFLFNLYQYPDTVALYNNSS